MSDTEKILCFYKQLELIKNENIRNFVKIILIETGDWFYNDPASSTGKNHPYFALGEGGLTRHTKAVVYFMKTFLDTKLYDIDEYHSDLMIGAAILHDIRKHTADGLYVENHAREGYNAIIETQKLHPELISEEDAMYMAIPISTHMGIWGEKQGEKIPQTDMEKLLHLADYCASRKELIGLYKIF